MDRIEAKTGSRSGARFHKCALQVNPHHYAGSLRGQSSEDNPADYVEAIVEKAAELGVTVLAIADHNSVADVPAFKQAATLRVLNERFALTADLDDAASIQRGGDAATTCRGLTKGARLIVAETLLQRC